MEINDLFNSPYMYIRAPANRKIAHYTALKTSKAVKKMDNTAIDIDIVDINNTQGKAVTTISVGENIENEHIKTAEEQDARDTWGNKIEFVLASISFSLGFGSVWRFPFLYQKNGGAFLIPYVISLIVLGIPLFLLETAIGQRLRRGPTGAWSKVNPKLAGIGMASVLISFFISIYYNVIVAWCFYYLFISFQQTLPYQKCPSVSNITSTECVLAGKASYHWYRIALDSSESINESGNFQWHLCILLLLSWLVIFCCTMKGVQTTGKIMYFTVLFPCLVLIIFFVRGVTLEGAGNGLKRMFTPQFEKLADPHVWFDAATQVFFTSGISAGGLISFASFNPINNNCKRDAVLVPLVSAATSIFICIVVFSILGFKATSNYNECLDVVRSNLTNTSSCRSLDEHLNDVSQGPGLIFIIFTEAITRMPVPQLWAVLLYCMLITLGVGCLLGLFTGVLVPLVDMKFLSLRREVLTGISCIISFLFGLIFCLRSGQYWIQLFNDYSVSAAILFVAFAELIVINFVYGMERFLDDIKLMTGSRPGWYWKLAWRFLGPPLSFLLLIANFIEIGRNGLSYTTWDKTLGKSLEGVSYPPWAVAVTVFLVLFTLIWIPLVVVLKHFGIFDKKPTDVNTASTTVQNGHLH